MCGGRKGFHPAADGRWQQAAGQQCGEDKTDIADQVEHDPQIHCERRFEPFDIRWGKGVLRNVQARLGKDEIGPHPHHKVCGDAEDDQRSAPRIAIPVAEHQQADEQDFHCAVEGDEKRNGRPHECRKDRVGRRRLAQRRGGLRRLIGGQRVAHDGKPVLLVCLVRHRRLDGSSSDSQLGRRRRHAVATENGGRGCADHEKADQRNDGHRFGQKGLHSRRRLVPLSKTGL